MKKFLRIIQTNYVIALVITLIAYLLYPPIAQYEWEIRTMKDNKFSLDFFIDIDNDGRSESLKISDNNGTLGSLELFSSDELLLNLTNLPYSIFIDSSNDIIINEYEKSYKEVLFLGEKRDSLYLIGVKYLNGKIEEPTIETTFLDILKPFEGRVQFGRKLAIEDLDGDGAKEVVIMGVSGYTILPRRMYVVDLQKNEVFRSPLVGVAYSDFTFVDYNSDGKKEIIVNTEAYCNVYESAFNSDWIDGCVHDSIMLANKETLLQYNDCSAWLIVFDNKLNFLFKPKPFEGWTGSFHSLPYKYKGEKSILSVYSNIKDTILKPCLLIHSYSGVLLAKKEVDFGSKVSRLKLHYNKDNKDQICVTNNNNEAFNVLNDLKVEKLSEDGCFIGISNSIVSKTHPQKLLFRVEGDYLNIYDANYNILTSHFIPGIWGNYIYLSSKLISDVDEIFMVNIGSHKVQLRFKHNYLFIFRGLIWIAIYILSWISLSIIKRFFSYKAIQEKRKFEKIVAERTEEINQQKDDLEKLTISLKEKNEEVFQQNIEIEKRREEVEQLYERLTSSVTYGKGIKDALLPSIEKFNEIFKDAFVFFRPKNVVGGDFYWVDKKGDRKIVIVGNASGEGISGGFLSLLATNLINSTVFNEEVTASSVLRKINTVLYQYLSSFLVNKNDGIEMAVVIVEPEKEKMKVEFASANIPVHYFSSDTVIGFETMQPNDYAIRADVNNLSFENKVFSLPKESMMYIATKGFYTQKGGVNLDTFGKTEFRANLMRINVLPIHEQKQILIDKFDNYKAGEEQTNDVLFVGLRI